MTITERELKGFRSRLRAQQHYLDETLVAAELAVRRAELAQDEVNKTLARIAEWEKRVEDERGT